MGTANIKTILEDDGTVMLPVTSTEAVLNPNGSTVLESRLQGIEGKMQGDWEQSDDGEYDYIKNKPTALSDFTNDVGYVLPNDGTFVKVRPVNAVYNNNDSWNLYLSGSFNESKFVRITLPDTTLTSWTMLYFEVSVMQKYTDGGCGKLHFFAMHNSTTGDWTYLKGTIEGNLSTTLTLYGSDRKYLYIGGIYKYGSVSIDKVMCGDAVTNIDIKGLTIDTVDSLPSTYQTGTIYGVGSSLTWTSNGLRLLDSRGDVLSTLTNSDIATLLGLPSAATATPLMDGTAAVGSSAKYAKEDHVHPTDTSRVPTTRTVNGKALSSDITLSASDVGALPSSTTIPTVGTLDTTAATAQTTSSSESFGGSVTLHKVSKTGDYGDLLNKPTIPSAGDFVTALGVSGNYVTWTKNGTINNITVPYATVAGKIGTTTVGSTAKPVYINAGVPTLLGTVGTSTMPVYLNNGAITQISSFKEAYLAWGGKNLTGTYAPIDAAMVGYLGGNKVAFVNPSKISVEYSRDAGVTWLDYEATDAQKTYLFASSPGNNPSFVIGKSTTSQVATADCLLRVTLLTAGAYIYTSLNKFIIYLSTSGSNNCYVTIRARKQQDLEDNVDTWTTFADAVGVSGWSGWNVINLTKNLTTYGNTKSSQYGQIQFIFGCGSHTSTTYQGLVVYRMMAFGGMGWTTPSNLAAHNHLYSWDNEQSGIFPKHILPKTNNDADLGSSTKKWRKVYGVDADISGSLTVGNTNIATALSGKADKVTNATSGNLAGLDSNGNLTDSGVSASSIPSDSNLVHKTGNETVGGMKTLTSGVTLGNSIDFLDRNANQHEITVTNSDFDQGGTTAVLGFEDTYDGGYVILRGVAEPTSNYDAANKKYIDDIVGDIETLLAAI